ncbi:MAG TPA: cyclic nucleotide-binding domain-containing protein [bacterium]|nr:cyclic nucleotide-binding domain-containing protein [bacterium]HPN29994.1 cyclic nucleotide-binding domain-containing protein [bacterium]
MLLTIEKVLILKSVEIFTNIPEECLVELATVINEIHIKAGETIFQKGDIGKSMFIIIEGEVKVHDGERIFAELGERSVFGELAALDPEPRSASVTAMKDTFLFKLEQDALYELMSEYIEVARGIIKVLCQRLRESQKN